VIWRSKAEKRDAILWCLRKANPNGLYGLELCRITGIGRATIYIHLAHLEEHGKIKMVRDSGLYPQRSKYFSI
jgi:predicted transcriptional regulator